MTFRLKFYRVDPSTFSIHAANCHARTHRILRQQNPTHSHPRRIVSLPYVTTVFTASVLPITPSNQLDVASYHQRYIGLQNKIV